MPNTGKRSQGCIPCKRMKVRCSEVRPTCDRCARVSRECTWQDSPSIFRSMNESSEQRALNHLPKRRKDKTKADESKEPSSRGVSASREPSHGTELPQRRKSSTRTTLSVGDVSTTSLSRSPSYRLASPSPVPPPAPDWPAQAVAYYLQEFTQSPDALTGMAGYMDYLSDFVASAREGSLIKEAVRAVSLAALGNRGGLDRLGVEGRKSYGRSLKCLRNCLAQGEKSDEVMAGMILMGQYEMISGDKPSGDLWQSHAHGQRAMLGLRGHSQFETARGRDLFRIAQVALLFKDISRCEAPAFPVADFPKEVFIHPHARKQVEIATRIGFLVHKARMYLDDGAPFDWRSGTPPPAAAPFNLPEGNRTPSSKYENRDLDWWTGVQSTAEEGWTLLNECEAWEAWAPSHWRYQEAPGLAELDMASQIWEETAFVYGNDSSQCDPSEREASRSSSPDALPHAVYIYQSVPQSSSWISLWAATTRLIEALIALHRALDHELSPFTRAETSDNVPVEDLLRHKSRLLVGKVLASLPYILGEIDSTGRLIPGGRGKCLGAFFALWPLNMICGLTVLSPGERAWVVRRLRDVSRTSGIQQAKVLASWNKEKGRFYGPSNWLKQAQPNINVMSAA